MHASFIAAVAVAVIVFLGERFSRPLLVFLAQLSFWAHCSLCSFSGKIRAQSEGYHYQVLSPSLVTERHNSSNMSIDHVLQLLRLSKYTIIEYHYSILLFSAIVIQYYYSVVLFSITTILYSYSAPLCSSTIQCCFQYYHSELSVFVNVTNYNIKRNCVHVTSSAKRPPIPNSGPTLHSYTFPSHPGPAAGLYWHVIGQLFRPIVFQDMVIVK